MRDTLALLLLAGAVTVGCDAPNPLYEPEAATPPVSNISRNGGRSGSADPGMGAGGSAAATVAETPVVTTPVTTPDAGASDALPPSGSEDAGTASDAAPTTQFTGDLMKGLTLYLPLDEMPGTSVAADASGKRASAQLRSIDAAAAWTSGASGRALALQGTSWKGYVDVSGTSLASAISQPFSVALWVRRGAATGATEVLISRTSLGARGPLFSLGLQDGVLFTQLNATAAYHLRLSANGSVPSDRWAHVAMTFDLRQVRLYVDGLPAGVAAYAQAVPLDTTSFMVGGLEQSNRTVGARFAGQIDEVLLYGRTLTGAEIAALARGARPETR